MTKEIAEKWGISSRRVTVLLQCDDPEWSNFTRFFAQNFNNLGLKNLLVPDTLQIVKDGIWF